MATFVSPHLVKKRVLQSFSQYLQRTAFHSPKPDMAQAQIKPPNVLVYEPKGGTFSSKQSPVLMLERCLPRNKYVVYDLPFERAPNDPWMDNCQLLVVPSDPKKGSDSGDPTISKPEVTLFKKYLAEGGKILNFNASLMDQMPFFVRKNDASTGNCKIIDQDGCVIMEKFETWNGGSLETQDDGCSAHTVLSVEVAEGLKRVAVNFSDECSKGQILHCTLPIVTRSSEGSKESSAKSVDKVLKYLLAHMGVMDKGPSDPRSAPPLSPCFLLCRDQKDLDKFLSHLGVDQGGSKEFKGGITIRFTPLTKDLPKDFETKLPILYPLDGMDGDPGLYRFDAGVYWQNLLSEDFGKVVIYGDVVSSTMDILEPLVTRVPSDTSVTCIAQQQLSGKGRGGNKWLSPPGTAMFSLTMRIPLLSNLGRHLPLIQHMVTVAVVRAIRSMPGLDAIDLRVKWPNDIYFGTGVKIGGVIVKSTIFRDNCIVTIGCGVNVENESPTTCINTIIQSVLPDHRNLTCEEVLARSLTSLEQLIAKYQREGSEQFLAFYYKYWIHAGADVKVQLSAENAAAAEGNATESAAIVDASIVGLDPDGFLRVAIKSGQKMAGQMVNLQPDGNSFDIIKNLIAMKAGR